MRLEASTAHICFWFPCCIQLCEKWLEEISDMTQPRSSLRWSAPIPQELLVCSPFAMDKETVGRDHPLLVCMQRRWHLQIAWRLMGSGRVSLDSLEEGGALPSSCASHVFSPNVRGCPAQVSWQCHSCGGGQEMKDRLQPPSPPGGGKEPTKAVCSFLVVAESTAGQRWWDAQHYPAWQFHTLPR